MRHVMLNKKRFLFSLICLVVNSLIVAADKISILIVDGQNNHDWASMTPYMKTQLEKTGLFNVSVSTTPPSAPKMPKKATAEEKEKFEKTLSSFKQEIAAKWQAWQPRFSDYQVILSNYNGEDWPTAIKNAFINYMKSGGNLVVVHAADNSFGAWDDYNKMIGLGGWGGRDQKSGPYVYYDNAGELIRDASEGRGGSHGAKHAFMIQLRNEHPITAGMPKKWLHAEDELYDSLRGPAENMTILASAYSEKSKRHEPMMMLLTYGKGKIFHTPMGHVGGNQKTPIQCVGFITTINRACEWLANEKVTQPIPSNFPTETQVSLAE